MSYFVLGIVEWPEELYRAYFVAKSVEWLFGRIHGIFCGEKWGVSVLQNK